MKKSIGEQIAKLPVEQRALVPEIKVEIEPIFEVTTPAPDMGPLTAIFEKMLSKPDPKINVTVIEPEKSGRKIKIDVERDGRGFIKSLTCTEI